MDLQRAWPKSRVVTHNLVLLSELERVARVFARHGIDWVVLKGLPLASRVYGSIADRLSVDNDILVRGADVVRAMAALTEAGYTSAPGRALDADRASTFQHPMRRTIEAGITARLELHWNAFPPHLFAASEELLWSHVEPYSLGMLELHVFDPTLTLVHLASHFVQHRCAEPRILEDVGRAVTRWHSQLDARELQRVALDAGAHAALALVLRATWQLGMTSAPPAVRSARANVILNLLRADRLPAAHTSYLRIALSLALADPRRWADALRTELLPHPAVLARIFEVEAVPARPHALYLRRLLRPLQRLLRAG